MTKPSWFQLLQFSPFRFNAPQGHASCCNVKLLISALLHTQFNCDVMLVSLNSTCWACVRLGPKLWLKVKEDSCIFIPIVLDAKNSPTITTRQSSRTEQFLSWSQRFHVLVLVVSSKILCRSPAVFWKLTQCVFNKFTVYCQRRWYAEWRKLPISLLCDHS